MFFSLGNFKKICLYIITVPQVWYLPTSPSDFNCCICIPDTISSISFASQSKRALPYKDEVDDVRRKEPHVLRVGRRHAILHVNVRPDLRTWLADRVLQAVVEHLAQHCADEERNLQRIKHNREKGFVGANGSVRCASLSWRWSAWWTRSRCRTEPGLIRLAICRTGPLKPRSALCTKFCYINMDKKRSLQLSRADLTDRTYL